MMNTKTQIKKPDSIFLVDFTLYVISIYKRRLRIFIMMISMDPYNKGMQV